MGYDEELPRMEKDGVNLDDEGQSTIGNILMTGDGQSVTENDAAMMN